MLPCPPMDRQLYISLFLTTLAAALGVSLVVPLLPVYAQSLGATGIELGLIFSGFSLARTILLPMVGTLSDKWGRRGFMLWGLFIYTAIGLGFVYSDTVYQLVLCRMIQGFGAAMVVPVARAYVGDMTPPGSEGRVMGQFNMAFFLGLSIGPWLGGFVKDLFGLNSAFYAMSVLSFSGFLLSFLTLPRDKIKGKNSGVKHMPYGGMLRNKDLAGMFIMRFGSIIGVGFNWTFLPIYAHESLKLSASRIGILVSLTVVMTTLLQPVFGPMADRINRHWMIFWGGGLASACLVIVPFCDSFYQLFMCNMLLGSAIGLYMPPLMALAVDVGRESGFMTRVMSLLEIAFSSGMVVGPLMAGVIKEMVGIDAIFYVGGAIGVLTCLIFLSMSRHKLVRA